MSSLNIGVTIGLMIAGVLGLAYMYYVKGRAERRKAEREALSQITKRFEEQVEEKRRAYEEAKREYDAASKSDDE